jgi:Cu+-exporting ATPase
VAASLELGSEHPLAAAILDAASARGIAFEPASEFTARTGIGVTGRVGGARGALGNRSLLAELGVPAGELAALEARAEPLRSKGETVVYVWRDGRVLGALGATDAIKPSAREALAELRQAGLRIAMLTGDARAEVGIAMGTGAAVAIESAGVTLVRGDLRGIVRARRLSRAASANLRQNLFLAFVYNALGVPIAMGALYPFFGLVLSPMFAAAAMSLSSLSVIANALRLRSV